MKSTHSDRLEKHLGGAKLREISESTKGWYADPLPLWDLPGVYACGDGDFVGEIKYGSDYTFGDRVTAVKRRLQRALRTAAYENRFQLNMAIASAQNFIDAYRSGYRENYDFNQSLASTGTSNRGALDAWYFSTTSASFYPTGSNPTSGNAAAPGGRALSKTDGGFQFNAPLSGNSVYTADCFISSNNNLNQALILYDRLFDVHQVNDTSNQSVTGVPTRYQNTSDPYATNRANGNFIFPVMNTSATGSSSHTYDNVQYVNQDGSAKTLPTLQGQSASTQNVGLIDMYNTSQSAFMWFAPLAQGDSGVQKITNMKKSSNHGGSGTNAWVIGHAHGYIAFPIYSYPTRQLGWSTYGMSLIDSNAALHFIAPNTITYF